MIGYHATILHPFFHLLLCWKMMVKKVEKLFL